MNRLDYFQTRLDSTIGPVDLLERIKTHPETVCVIDVRNGPASLLKDRIPGALQIPQSVIVGQSHRLPRERILILYGWGSWCNLAAESAVPLLKRGFDVRELSGGMKGWKALHFPTVPVDAEALDGQTEPLSV